MADNTVLDGPGSGGDTIATASLTISGDTAKVQMEGMGILSGAEGSWTYSLIVGGAGAVAAGVQRVTLASDDPAVALLTTIDADTSKIPSLGNAAMAAATPVTLASDDTLTAAANALLTTIDADTSKIPALGTAVMTGSTPVTLATDDTMIAATNALLTTIDADTSKITACDTGAVVISSGTVTANLGATDNAVLDVIAASVYVDDDDWTDSTSKHVLTGGVYQSSPQTITDGDVGPFQVTTNGYLITSVNGTVTVGTHAVTQSGTWNVGTVTTVTTVSSVTAIANALPAGDNNIGNVDIVTLPAGNLGQQAKAASLSVAPATDITDATYIGDIKFGEALLAGTNTIGGTISQASSSVVYDGTTACTVKRFHAVTSTSDTSIITAVAGKKFRVLSLTLIGLSATATNIHLETKTTNTDCFGDSTSPIPVAVDADGDNHGGLVLPWNPGGWFQTADANEDMAIILSAAQPVLICGNYIEVA